MSVYSKKQAQIKAQNKNYIEILLFNIVLTKVLAK